MELKIRRKFDAAHRLVHHKGKCSNIHGHTYHIEVSIEGPVNGKTGMVMDFHDFKDKVDKVLEPYDHAFVANKADKEVVKFIKSLDGRLVIMEGEPTAENMSQIMAHNLRLEGLEHPVVRVFETEDCSCASKY